MEKVKVIVGSESDLKLRATQAAFAKAGFSAAIIGFKSESGVPDQPFGFSEISKGARNRFLAAARKFPGADFFVGIESGLVQQGPGWFDVICVIVASSKKGTSSPAYSACLPVPSWMVDYIKVNGGELGTVVQKVAGGGEKDAAKYLSNGIFTREEQLEQAIIAGLIPLINPDRYVMPGMS